VDRNALAERVACPGNTICENGTAGPEMPRRDEWVPCGGSILNIAACAMGAEDGGSWLLGD